MACEQERADADQQTAGETYPEAIPRLGSHLQAHMVQHIRGEEWAYLGPYRGAIDQLDGIALGYHERRAFNRAQGQENACLGSLHLDALGEFAHTGFVDMVGTAQLEPEQHAF